VKTKIQKARLRQGVLERLDRQNDVYVD